MVSNQESNALAKQLPIGYKIQNYTVKAYLNQSYFANIYLVQAPSTGEDLATGQDLATGENKHYVLKEYFPYFTNRKTDFNLDAGAYQEHLAWGKAHAFKKLQFLSQINSPHVANIRSYFEANNTVYALRDYYEGLTLSEWLRQMRLEHLAQKLDLSSDAISEAMLSEVKLSLKDTEKLLYPIIDALSFMHSYRASEFAYSHENISPDNIFLEKTTTNGLTSPRPVLLDGIGAGAKINPDLLASGYTPPESYGQYAAYKPSGDVYSLAATMYSLLTGNVPAHAQERLKIRDNEDLDLSSVEPDLDLKLCKALNTDPNDRYGSALSFLQALQTPLVDISEASDIRDALAIPTVPSIHEASLAESAKDEVDPSLKATEVGSILWSDPSEDMMPVTFGDYAGNPDNKAKKSIKDSSDIILDHPAFYQVDGQTNLQPTRAQTADSASSKQAMAALNNHDFEQHITEHTLFEETLEAGAPNASTYEYSESVKITAPETFLTQERIISAEEAKTTLFSVHPLHPLDSKSKEQETLQNSSNNPASIDEQNLLHHAELLKGSTAFKFINGKLKNNTKEDNLPLEEDYGKTLVYNTKVAETSQQALLEADSLLNKDVTATPDKKEYSSVKSATQKELEQTGIKGLSQWPITALADAQNKRTRERKPVKKRFPTVADVLNTGFSVNATQQSSNSSTSRINLQQVVRLILLLGLLAALGVLLYSMQLQATPRTPFQSGTARASSQNNVTPNNVTQNIKHASNTQPNSPNQTTLAGATSLQVIPEFIFEQHQQAVRAVAFNPEGTLIASASDDKNIHLWDRQNQTMIKTLQPSTGDAFIKDISFSTDHLAAVDTSGMLVLWDVASGARQKRDLYQHVKALNTVSFSHDAKFLAAGSEDGKVLIWERNNNSFGRMQMIDMSQQAIHKLNFSPNDSSLLVAADARLQIHLWTNNRNRSRSQTITAWNSMSQLNDMHFSSDGSHIALAGLDKDSIGVINIWNLDTRELELTLHHPKYHSESFAIRPESANSVRAITADPQGHWWASAGIDGIIHLWSSNTGTLLGSMPTNQKGIYTLDANPVTQGLVTAAADGSVQTWLIE